MPTVRTPEQPPAQEELSFGPLEPLIGFQLRRAQLAVYEDFLRDAPVSGLTPGQLGILVLVKANRDSMQQRLCERLGVDKSTLTLSLDRLSERGLLKRVRSDDDRRRNSLRLTAKGEEALKRMMAHVEQHERRVTAKLTAAERRTLFSLLRRVGAEGPRPR